MKPPRIPKYLRDEPLVWIHSENELASIAIDRRPRWGKRYLPFFEVRGRYHWWWVLPNQVAPLTETARQVLAGEWR